MSAWIDISRTLANGMIHWPGDLPFRCQRRSEISGPGSSNCSEISTSVHAGTHIDAPLHYISAGQDVSQLPLDKLCGPVVVVHVREDRDVQVEDLEKAEIREGEGVLLRTPAGALWEKPEFDESFHAIGTDAAIWLVDHGVRCVGVDSFSVDRFHDPSSPVHYTLLGNGIIVIEGLDLSQVAPGRYEMIALPLKIAGSDGGPARVIIRSLAR